MKDIVMMLISVGLGAVGQIAFKYGAIELEKNPGITLLDKLKAPIVLGLILYGVSTIIYLMVLRRMNLSVAYPMISLGYVLVFIASYFLFHEPMSYLRVAGMVCIILGIMMVTRS
jgi:multidrug transporter EmrE-like cation transporter